MHIQKCLLATLFVLTIGLILPNPVWGEFVIVIDPGHGGRDTGTQHRKCKQDEKTIALNVALKLGELIKNNYDDVRVVYTRKTDVYPTLPERVEKAKKAKGDLFISIHVNASPNTAPHGFETYIFGTDGTTNGKSRVQERLVEERENLDLATGKEIDFNSNVDIETQILCQAQREKHNKQSREIANDVQKSLIAQLKTTSYAGSVSNRGVLAKNLFVLCFSPMPAILVEMGYISNRAEEKFINTEEGQTALARGIFNGFKKYKSGWDKRQLSGDQAKKQSKEEPKEEVQEPTGDKEVEALDQREPKQQQNDKPKQQQNDKPESPKKEGLSEVSATGKTCWRIQFLSGDKLLKKGSSEFKGLTPVEYRKVKGMYKYYYSVGSSTAELKSDMAKVRKLFPSAFYVKFDAEGNRIDN